MVKQQYTLYMENNPGTLAKIAGMLAKAKINMEGISVAESTDSALVQIIVSNAAKTKKLLDAENIQYVSQKVAVVVLDHAPGALSDFALKLAREGININYIYGTASDAQDKSCLVVSADNLEKVVEVAASL